MNQTRFICWLLSLAVVAGFCVVACAQPKKECDGIVGRLTTEEGWVIVDVTIRAVNKTTKQALEAKTDSSGEYVMCLPPGTYDVFASMLAFKPAKRRSVPVVAKSRNIIDFTLKRGKPIIVNGAHP